MHHFAQSEFEDDSADEPSVAIRAKPSTLSDFLPLVERHSTTFSALSTLFALRDRSESSVTISE